MDFTELQGRMDQIVDRENQIASEKQQLRADAVAMVQKIIGTFNIQPDELDFSGKQKNTRRRGSAGAPKYKNPFTEQTWSGRGRSPKWVSDLEKEGISLQDCLIEKEVAAPAETPAE